jgi:hypothetical protein
MSCISKHKWRNNHLFCYIENGDESQRDLNLKHFHANDLVCAPTQESAQCCIFFRVCVFSAFVGSGNFCPQGQVFGSFTCS